MYCLEVILITSESERCSEPIMVSENENRLIDVVYEKIELGMRLISSLISSGEKIWWFKYHTRLDGGTAYDVDPDFSDKAIDVGYRISPVEYIK